MGNQAREGSGRRREESSRPLRSWSRASIKDRLAFARRRAPSRKATAPYRKWAQSRSGIYTTNGTILAAIKRSVEAARCRIFSAPELVGNFHGYFPSYSKLFAEEHDRLTFCVLKAHTLNRGGQVTLKSTDPLVAPEVNFHYFEEGTDKRRRRSGFRG